MADAQCLIESDATGHSEKFKQGLYAMRNDPETSDVTLICEDLKVVKGHKMVLKSFSPVLREILKNIPVTSAVVYLKGINSNVMDPLLDFMYYGKASIDKDLVYNFFKLGKQFEVELLSEYWDSENDIYDTEEGNREDGEVLNDTENDSKKNENIETFACPRCYKIQIIVKSLSIYVAIWFGLSRRGIWRFDCLVGFEHSHKARRTITLQ